MSAPPWPTSFREDDGDTGAPPAGSFWPREGATPGAWATSHPAGQRVATRATLSGPWALGAGLLMVACLGLHIAAMFPTYTADLGTSIVSTAYETAAYAGLEVGWALAAALVLTGASVGGGAALGAGLGAVEVGLLATDVAAGFQVSNGSSPGAWLAIAGLGAGLAGALVGASAVDHPGTASVAHASARAWLTALVGLGAVAAFWPSWDHYHVVFTSGQVQDATIGNVFSRSLPAAVTAGGLVTGVAMAVVTVTAAFWSPPQLGGWAVAGVAIALGSQVISGAVQAQQPIRELLGNTNGVDVARSRVWLTGYWVADAAAAAALVALALWAGWEGQLKARSAPR